MSRFARRRQVDKTVDLIVVGPEGGPEILRVTLKRISNAEAAGHGLERLMVMADVAKLETAHKPAVVKQAEDVAARLKATQSDLSAYTPEQTEAALEHILRADKALRENPEYLHKEADEDLPQKQARAARQQRLTDHYEKVEGIPPALIRLLLKRRKLLEEQQRAELAVTQHETGRLAGMARSIGKARTQQAATDRAAIVCAAVTHHQSLIPVDSINRANLDPTNPAHWQPHPDTPQPEPIQLTADENRVDEDAGIFLLSQVHTSAEIAILAEHAYLHAVGGEEGRAALARFRQGTPPDGGDVPDQPGQGADHG